MSKQKLNRIINIINNNDILNTCHFQLDINADDNEKVSNNLCKLANVIYLIKKEYAENRVNDFSNLFESKKKIKNNLTIVELLDNILTEVVQYFNDLPIKMERELNYCEAYKKILHELKKM